MVGLSFAAVPLYRLFCQVTGFGGTTQVAVAAPGQATDVVFTVRFDANVAPGLPWRFRPAQLNVEVKPGVATLVHYVAENKSRATTHGTATYNVTPTLAGAYFTKMACFCFDEQTLASGQTADMPVSFFVDPAILDDPDLAQVRTITLSYTFFPARAPKAAAAGRDAAAQPVTKLASDKGE